MVVVQLRAINVSTHSRPKAAEIAFNLELKYGSVSTHSRPKAAGYAMYQGAEESRVFQHTAARRRLPKRTTALHPRLGFNTQPPEGGCPWFKLAMHDDGMFQHTAARRRLSRLLPLTCALAMFQHTAARRRLVNLVVFLTPVICFNTQPPEGGCGEYAVATNWRGVSTHSRPKAAGVCKMSLLTRSSFQHTAARRRLAWLMRRQAAVCLFQHTAARRRLACAAHYLHVALIVSTHSRPKAAALHFWVAAKSLLFQHTAARRRLSRLIKTKRFFIVSTHSRPKAAGHLINNRALRKCFNTQPPEGGWPRNGRRVNAKRVSTHSRPKAAAWFKLAMHDDEMFQHTAARRRLGKRH